MSLFTKPLFIPNQVTVDDILQALINAELIVNENDYVFAKTNNGLVFSRFSYSTKSWCYYIAFEDEDSYGKYFITTVRLWVSDDGTMCADFDGCPEFDNLTKAAVIKKMTQLSR